MAVRLARAERRARRALADYPIPRPWSLEEFVAGVSQRRRRPVRMFGVVMSEHLDRPTAGAWSPREHVDVILYDKTMGMLHITNTVLHEVGHIVLGHDPRHRLGGGSDVVDPDLEVLFTCHGPAAADGEHGVRYRVQQLPAGTQSGSYWDSRDELEAEQFAYNCWLESGLPLTSARPRGPGGRLTAAFEHQGRSDEHQERTDDDLA